MNLQSPMKLKRKKLDPDYKEEVYTWPVMARKMKEWENNQQPKGSATESYRMVILDVGNGIEKKKSNKRNGRQVFPNHSNK